MKNVSVWELAFELFRSGAKPKGIARRLVLGRVTIYRWLRGIRYRASGGSLRRRKKPRGREKRRCLDTQVVLKIKKIRQETGWCGEKIVWELKTRYRIKVSQASVYRVLNRYFKLRTRWKKNVARGPQPTAVKPRDVVQANTVDLGGLFAYTAADSSPEKHLLV